MHRERSAALRNDVHRIETEWQTAPAMRTARCQPILLLIGIRWSPEHRCNFLLVTISVSRSRALAPFAALPLTRPNGTISRNVFSSVPLLRFHRGCILNPHVIPQDPSSFSAILTFHEFLLACKVRCTFKCVVKKKRGRRRKGGEDDSERITDLATVRKSEIDEQGR